MTDQHSTWDQEHLIYKAVKLIDSYGVGYDELVLTLRTFLLANRDRYLSVGGEAALKQFLGCSLTPIQVGVLNSLQLIGDTNGEED